MGRVKGDGKGGFYWDENDEGPDQSGGTWKPGQQGAASPAAIANPNQNYPGGSATFDERQPTGTPAPTGTGATPGGSTPVYAPIQGFDFGKIQSGGGTAEKYSPALRTFSAYLGSGGQVARGSLQGAVDYAKSHGFPGAQAIGDDKIDFGDGNAVDVIQSNGSIWFNNMPGGGGGATGQTIPGVGGASGVGGNTASSFSAPGFGTGGTGSMDPQSSALYDLLMKRATQGLEIDRNNPVIRQQSDAYGAQQERNRRNYLSDVAEKYGDNANISAEERHSAESVGQATGSFEGQLMAQELAARRQEIEQALQGAVGFLTAQQRLALENELSKLSLAERQYEFQSNQAQGESEFSRNLAQRGYEFDITDQWRNSPLAS